MPMTPSNVAQFEEYKQKHKPQFGPPDCPHPPEYQKAGFGLAGGGYGPYMFCGLCYRIYNKIAYGPEEDI